MKHSNILIFGLLMACFFSACQSQDNHLLDLSQIPNQFSPAAFYEQRLAKTQEIISTDTKKLDKKEVIRLLNYPMFAKDTLGYYSSEGRFPTDLFLESTQDWMTRKLKPSEIFGYGYKTVAFNEDKDTIAILNGVAFPKMNAVEDVAGKLMYLMLEKSSKSNADYDKINSFLAKSNKKIAVEDPETTGAYYENDKYYFFLNKKIFKEQVLFSDDSVVNKNENTEKIELSLSVFTKAYIHKMEEAKIYSPGQMFWKKRPE